MSILAKEENSQSKIGRKQKEKERKSLIKDRKKTKEICKKVFGLDKYLNSIDLSPPNKERKRPKHLEPKQKRKRPKHLEPNSPPKNTIPKKNSY